MKMIVSNQPQFLPYKICRPIGCIFFGRNINDTMRSNLQFEYCLSNTGI